MDAAASAPGASPSPGQLLEIVARVVRSRAGVAAAYLFGSAAEGRATALSDVDVAILFGADFDDARERILTEIATELARAASGQGEAGPAPMIDLRDIERLPLTIRGRIVTDGRLAASNDDVRRVRFETRTRQRYFDFLPFLRTDTREGLQALREHYLDG